MIILQIKFTCTISDIPNLSPGARGSWLKFILNTSRTKAITTIIDVEDKLAEEIKEETEELIKEN